jgi:5-methylcytosine-specific restriction protein A
MANSSPFHSWYGRASWLKRRRHQLQLQPLCQMCLRENPPRITAARVVDHVEPHNGDYNKFRLGAVQSLCDRCHNSTKRIVETRGYDTAVGIDGMPTDCRHPIYAKRS